MPDRTLPPGSRPAPPTPLNNRPVNRAALAVLKQATEPLQPWLLHLQTLLGAALELDDPGPAVPEAVWPDLKMNLAPLLTAEPKAALRWWTSHPEMDSQQSQEEHLTNALQAATTPEQAMWVLLDWSRARLRAQNSPKE